jgi:hypothetical protein
MTKNVYSRLCGLRVVRTSIWRCYDMIVWKMAANVLEGYIAPVFGLEGRMVLRKISERWVLGADLAKHSARQWHQCGEEQHCSTDCCQLPHTAGRRYVLITTARN